MIFAVLLCKCYVFKIVLKLVKNGCAEVSGLTVFKMLVIENFEYFIVAAWSCYMTYRNGQDRLLSRVNAEAQKRIPRYRKQVTCHVFTQTIHVVVAPYLDKFARVVVPHSSKSVQTRQDTHGLNIAQVAFFPLLWLLAFTAGVTC